MGQIENKGMGAWRLLTGRWWTRVAGKGDAEFITNRGQRRGVMGSVPHRLLPDPKPVIWTFPVAGFKRISEGF